jgi:hypothetical protein
MGRRSYRAAPERELVTQWPGSPQEAPMDLLQTILSAQNGQAVDQIGRQLGLDRSQTMSAIEQLLPALAGGVARNAASPDGLASLEAALTGGGHSRYLDNPMALGQPDAIQDGNGILGHIFGSKDVSRQVAANASAQTGIGADILKKMLPMLASVAMAAMAQRASRTANGQVTLGPSSGGGLFDLLGPLLGGGKPGGGGLGDVLGSIGGLFRK